MTMAFEYANYSRLGFVIKDPQNGISRVERHVSFGAGWVSNDKVYNSGRGSYSLDLPGDNDD